MAVDVGYAFVPKTFYLDPTRVEEYVLALGVPPEPDWSPTPGAAIPPGLLMYVTTYGADDVHAAFDLPWRSALYGGSRYDYRKQVRIGDTLGVAPVVSARSTSGPPEAELTFWELRIDYTDAAGEVVVVEHSTTIARAAS